MITAPHGLHLLGMDPSILSGAGALGQLRNTSPAAYTLIAQWQNLRAEIARAESDEKKQAVIARLLHDSYHLTGKTFVQIYQRLRAQVRIAQEELQTLFEEYLPRAFEEKVLPVPLDPDPVTLIENGLPLADGHLALTLERREFEARRNLLLGLLFFDITVEHWIGRDRAGNPDALTKHLVARQILAKMPKVKRLASFHDPNKKCQCVGIDEFCPPGSRKGFLKRQNRLRLAKLVVNGSNVPILYSIRAKKPLSIIRRMLVDKEWDPRRVRDLRAFRFCYRNEEELRRSYTSVAERLVPGGAGDVKDRFTAHGKNANPHSDPEFRGIKHLGRIKRRTYEVDHLLATTWCNIQHSHAPINHELYHARQMWEIDPPGLFHCVAPVSIYGVDWTDTAVQREIQQHIIASLPK